MKRLTTLTAVLLAAALVFMGCSTASNSSSGDNNNNENPNSNSSQTSNKLEFSDGNWTLVMRVTSTQQSSAGNFTYKFSVQNGKATVNSGTMDTEVDITTLPISSDSTDEEFETAIEELNEAMALYGQTVTYSYDKTTKKFYMHMPMDEEDLEDVASWIETQNELPSDVPVTSNANKTMYTFTITYNGTTSVYTFTKDE